MKWLFYLLVLVTVSSCTSGVKGKPSRFIGRDPTWYVLQEIVEPANLTAFTNVLIEEIAKTSNYKLDLVDLGNQQLIPALELKEVGAILSSLGPDVISEEKYSFSLPFLALGPVLVVRQESSAASLNDIQGKIVGVDQYDNSVLIAQNIPSLVIELYQNKPDALDALNRGDYDGVLMSIVQADALVSHFYPGKLKIVTQPLNDKALRLITLKGQNDTVIEHFNKGLSAILKSGKYKGLLQTYPIAIIKEKPAIPAEIVTKS